MIRASALAALLLALVTTGSWAQPSALPPDDRCGEVMTIETHAGTTTRYALAYPPGAPAHDARIVLVLLVGGGGHLDLDAHGCPRALKGSSLVRSLPLFQGAGFVTALVDAPSDHPGEDGLAGFRTTAPHADDLGKVIADLRARTNAAARLSPPSAPDGLVLTSALMSGGRGGQKPWVMQTVFDVRLEKIRVPVLVVGHAADSCIRSPAGLMADITRRTGGAREQVVTVTGGPGGSRGAGPSVEACEGRAPHGFVEQEAEVAAGIARFIRGEGY